MRESEFNALLVAIDEWSTDPYIHPDEPLSLTEDLSDLTHGQWLNLQDNLKRNQVSFLQMSESNIIDYSPEAWQSLFAMLKGSNINKFFLKKELVSKYSPEQWVTFFAGTKEFLTAFGINFSGFIKMNSESMTCFFKAMENSNIKELDLSYDRFEEGSKEAYMLFFNGLVDCQNIKRLILDGNRTLGASKGSFWNICADNIANTAIEYLNLDGIALFKISENNWVNFCEGVQGSSINTLSLRNNKLYSFKPEQWKWFFAGLSSTKVQELDLRENHSLGLKDDKWKAFCQGLRETSITKLNYEPIQLSINKNQQGIIEGILEENRLNLSASNEDIGKMSAPKNILRMYEDAGKKPKNIYPLTEIQGYENKLMPLDLKM